MSAEAFEAFKEKMKRNSAFIKAIQKTEKNQKKHEDKLIKILIQFIQGHGTDLALLKLLAAAMDKNIPADFLFSIIVLAYPEIQDELAKLLESSDIEDQDEISQEEMVKNGMELQLHGVKEETVP